MKRFVYALPLLLLVLLTGCKPKSQYPITEVTHPEWAESGVIYEVNVRQYTGQLLLSQGLLFCEP